MPSDYQQAVPLVRLRIADKGDNPVFSDEELGMFLAVHEGGVYRASADALRTLAANEVLVSKVIRTQELQTSGDRVAEALRRLADDYDAKADHEEAETEGALHLVNFGSGRPRNEGEEWRY